MARPIVLAFIMFGVMSVTLYMIAHDEFMEVLRDGALVSCVLLPSLYFYYGDDSRFHFHIRS